MVHILILAILRGYHIEKNDVYSIIVTMLVSSVKVKAESSEITNLLEQFYDLNNGELPFAMTEEELRCVDGVLYDETSCCCTRRHSLIPVLRFQTTSAISGTLLLLTMNH